MTTLDMFVIGIGLLCLFFVSYVAVRGFGWTWLAGVVFQLIVLTVIIAIFMTVLLFLLFAVVQPLLPDKTFLYDHPTFTAILFLVLLFAALATVPAKLNRLFRRLRSRK